VDVGGFAEPRKILCQCVYPPLSKYQYTPDPRMGEPEFPNNWYQSLFLKKRVFDPNSKIKVLKTCFWHYHRVEEEEKNSLVKPRRRTDVLHDRTLQHAPTTALPTRDHLRHALHASSSPDCLQLNRVDPPRQQPVISHASNSAQSSATPSDQSSTVTSATRVHVFATSSKVGPGLITWMPRHLATSSHLVLIQCFADTILAWHVASSAPSVDLKLWLLRSEPSEVRLGWSQCRFQ
jgi:hypothetical protein